MLAFERHGSGDPLVLVHGVTHRRQAWYPVLDELAEQREVILVDLPGHGESPPLVLDGRPCGRRPARAVSSSSSAISSSTAPHVCRQFARRARRAGRRRRGRRA